MLWKIWITLNLSFNFLNNKIKLIMEQPHQHGPQCRHGHGHGNSHGGQGHG